MQNQNLPAKQSKYLSKKLDQEPSWTPDEQTSLAVILGRVFDMQKQYGKSAEQINNIVAGFCWALGKYPIEKVVSGIQQYIIEKNDMPTPADIKSIIDPSPPERIWDKTMYFNFRDIFKKEGPYGLSEEEYEYMRGYEEYVFKSHREAS